MSTSERQNAEAGQKLYTHSVLNFYGLWVLGISNSFIWKCPTRKQLAHYRKHIQPQHLDVGVGTGYYLDKCGFPEGCQRLGLLDIIPNSLSATSARVYRYTPEIFLANVMAPVTIDAEPYQSIGVNYLLHCLSGKLADKAVLFDNLIPYLAEGGASLERRYCLKVFSVPALPEN